MKRKFLLTILCLGLLSLHYGCQKEIEELEGLESSDSELFSTIDFSTFKDNIKTEDIKNSHINKLVNHQALAFGQLRFKSQSENFIISIDSTDVLMAEKDGVTSYTFKTQTTNMSKTTNYVLAHDEHNNTAEYYLSYGDDGSSTIIDPVSGYHFTPKSRSIWCPISREIWACVCAGHEPGNCVGICTGGFHQITVVTNEPCPSGGGEGDGGGPGDGGTGGNGNGNGEGTGGGSGDGGSGGNDLPIDGPIVTKPRKFEQEYEECLLGNYDSTICDCVANGNSLNACIDDCNSDDISFNAYYSEFSPFSVDLSEVRVPCDSIDTSDVDANEKFMCVYKRLTELDSFKNILNSVFGNSEVFNVKFVIEENLKNSKDKNVKGLAIKNDETNYTIKLDKFVVENHSLLFIANLIIHESIHTNLYARASLESNANLYNEFISNQDYDFEESFLLYYYGSLILGDNNWQHNFMANILLTEMSELTGEFHNLYQDSQFREYLGTEFDWETSYTDLSIAGSLRETNYFSTTYTNNLDQSIVQRVLINASNIQDLSESNNICEE